MYFEPNFFNAAGVFFEGKVAILLSIKSIILSLYKMEFSR